MKVGSYMKVNKEVTSLFTVGDLCVPLCLSLSLSVSLSFFQIDSFFIQCIPSMVSPSSTPPRSIPDVPCSPNPVSLSFLFDSRVSLFLDRGKAPVWEKKWFLGIYFCKQYTSLLILKENAFKWDSISLLLNLQFMGSGQFLKYPSGIFLIIQVQNPCLFLLVMISSDTLSS